LDDHRKGGGVKKIRATLEGKKEDESNAEGASDSPYDSELRKVWRKGERREAEKGLV